MALPELFDTAEFAEAVGIERRLAQQDDLLLAGNGVLDAAGKRSGAVVYRRGVARARRVVRPTIREGSFRGPARPTARALPY